MKKILITGSGFYVGESVRNCNFGQNDPRIRDAHSVGIVKLYMENVKQIFGIGAAFNFYTGDLHNNKKEIGGLRFIWLERIFKEPKKQLKRFGRAIGVFPKMYWEERKRAQNNRK